MKQFYDEKFAGIATVAGQRAKYTKRELQGADAATQLLTNLGHPSQADARAIVDRGLKNCNVTAQDILRQADINGDITRASLKGKTTKQKTPPNNIVLTPRMTQQQQAMVVDIFSSSPWHFLLPY